MIPLSILAIILLFICWLMVNGGDSVADSAAPLSPAGLDALTTVTPLTSASANYVCDSVAVQGYASARWQLDLTKGTAKRSVVVIAWHDGSASAGASNAYWTIHGGGPQGTVDVTISCALTGSGSSQVLELVCNAATTGWTANSQRIPLKAIPQ